MTSKSAAFLAFIGMLLLTVALAFGLVRDLMGTLNGVVPAVAVLHSLIHTFAALSVTVFFFAFQKDGR